MPFIYAVMFHLSCFCAMLLCMLSAKEPTREYVTPSLASMHYMINKTKKLKPDNGQIVENDKYFFYYIHKDFELNKMCKNIHIKYTELAPTSVLSNAHFCNKLRVKKFFFYILKEK